MWNKKLKSLVIVLFIVVVAAIIIGSFAGALTKLQTDRINEALAGLKANRSVMQQQIYGALVTSGCLKPATNRTDIPGQLQLQNIFSTCKTVAPDLEPMIERTMTSLVNTESILYNACEAYLGVWDPFGERKRYPTRAQFCIQFNAQYIK